ncbi:MAG: translation initiation factor IF-2 subunit gamma [Thermoprotei archaeon]|nr:MAG: translation initiation factor IF-2 subunit gamma [Thermoprotei archaeon]RLF24372.1 MAG: translation initiation factor IF-2 subunit gamma [Thermoprotei archaeon]
MDVSEVEKIQPLTNVGTAGHVDNGKSTLVLALTGIWTAYHSEELKRGVTLKLGYADCEILKCPNCPPPQCYTTNSLSPDYKCRYCGADLELIRKVSFVDVPGHEMLMATMLAGATLMDGAILVVDASRDEPLPQTREHFKALEIIGVRNLIVVQNKVDIAPEDKVKENYRRIREFLEGTWAENAPIIPISALHKVNIDVLVYAIEKLIPTPQRDYSRPFRMLIARSFDVNKPGTPPEKLMGGVIGGTILQGKLAIGDEIEIRPGIRVTKGGRPVYEPIFTEVISLKAGKVAVEEAYPGGLIGVGTTLDPSVTKADALIGNVAGKPGTLPPVWTTLRLEANLLERVVGTKEMMKVERIRVREPLMINVGTATTLGIVTHVRGDEVEIVLRKPICTEAGSRVAISRNIHGRWRLIGWGIIR